jgi:hypothetical protein
MKRLQVFAYPVVLVIVFFVYLSCDVQAFTPATHLSAPLDIQAITNDPSNGFWLQFEGFNTEPYFSGYTVFISPDNINWLTLLNPAALTNNADSNLLTVVATPVTVETAYYLNVVSSLIPPLNTPAYHLINGNTYYFYVQAYTSEYSNTSLPSETLAVIYNGPAN